MSANSNSSRAGTLLSLCLVWSMLFPFHNALSSVVWAQVPTSNWSGVLRTDAFLPARGGTVRLDSGTNHYSAAVNKEGAFSFQNLNDGLYSVTVLSTGNLYRSATKVSIPSEGPDITL